MIAHNTRASVDWGATAGPFAFCDRCNFSYNLKDLHWQMEWRGLRLANLRLLVCCRCLDLPQEQLRTIFIPPDPAPVKDARPGYTTQQETDYRKTQTLAQRITQLGDDRITDGESPGPPNEIIPDGD